MYACYVYVVTVHRYLACVTISRGVHGNSEHPSSVPLLYITLDGNVMAIM